MGVTAACQTREFASKTPFPFETELVEEIEMFKKETRCMVDRMLEIGEGDIAVGSIKALESGEFDIPFMPSKYVHRQVQIGRDAKGAVRYVDPGRLPLSKEVLDFHREKLAGRYAGGFDYKAILQDINYFVHPVSRSAAYFNK